MTKIHYDQGHHDITLCGELLGTVESTRHYEKVTCIICKGKGGINRFIKSVRQRQRGQGMTNKIVVILLLLMVFVMGCESAYTDCSYDCLKYQQNCSISGSVCIPDKCADRTCDNQDMLICNNKCS